MKPPRQSTPVTAEFSPIRFYPINLKKIKKITRLSKIQYLVCIVLIRENQLSSIRLKQVGMARKNNSSRLLKKRDRLKNMKSQPMREN